MHVFFVPLKIKNTNDEKKNPLLHLLNTLNIQKTNANFLFHISHNITFVLKQPAFSFGFLNVFTWNGVERGPFSGSLNPINLKIKFLSDFPFSYHLHWQSFHLTWQVPSWFNMLHLLFRRHFNYILNLRVFYRRGFTRHLDCVLEGSRWWGGGGVGAAWLLFHWFEWGCGGLFLDRLDGLLPLDVKDLHGVHVDALLNLLTGLLLWGLLLLLLLLHLLHLLVVVHLKRKRREI